MIGVIADPADHDVVREFFELFKTPWEFYRESQPYDVVICANGGQPDAAAKVVIVYAGRKTSFDNDGKSSVVSQPTPPVLLKYHGNRIPIYGDTVAFTDKADGLLTVEGSQHCGAYIERVGETSWARIGYDLFHEVRALLISGQPPGNAAIPTLDVHIEFLRNLIIGCGISFVEIPPVPQGFQFIACLTHDVDDPSIRQHRLDHTIVGFLFRVIVGSVIDAFLGRMSIRDAARNWLAAIKLPFVYVGLAKDFWRDFADRYVELENGLPSTFFVIPRKDYPGKCVDSRASALRAVRYEAKELTNTISGLKITGHEIGLHGIDAWIDANAAREELEEIRRLTRTSDTGVRMHWLYYNEHSPALLERAGATYDSTIGYNETVGYRAGTTQAYKPLKAERLMELPLHAMDTALFYLSYLALSPRKASARLRQLVDTVVQYGGCFTVNWHDRSLAPERLWGGCYRELIQDLEKRGAWFATASQATSWFRKRRSAAFETDSAQPNLVRIKIAGIHADDLPGLRLRINKAGELAWIAGHSSSAPVDVAVDETVDTNVLSEAGR